MRLEQGPDASDPLPGLAVSGWRMPKRKLPPPQPPPRGGTPG
jgi:hypothetical protein